MMFSVLVPVYNVEKYLCQCIETIIGQTEQDFELILVNDGSKESSGRICEEYKRKLPDKIKVIHQENKGLLLSRRVSISEAKGEYCVFVDADDYIRKDMLAVIKRTIIQSNTDLVIFNYTKVTDDGKFSRAQIFPMNQVFTEETKALIYEKIIKEDSLNNIVIKAVKSNLIDKNFDYCIAKHVNIAEDLLQTLPIVTNANKIIYINEDLYYYRQNSSSMTKMFNPIWYESITYVYIQLSAYMKIWNLYNEYGRGLLQHRYLQMVKEGIRQVSLPSCTWDKAKKAEFLQNLAHSNYFIDAYDNKNLKCEDIRWLIMLDLMRKNKIWLLLRIIDVKRALERKTMKI